MKDKTIPIVSLFSGAGGLDVGFRAAGFRTILAVDHKDYAVDTFNHNSPDGTVAKVADLSILPSEELVTWIKQTNSTPRGIIGGPPCQGFSRGNIRSFADDPRNKLPLHFAELVKTLKDEFSIDFFVFENVLGIRDQKHLETFGSIKRHLEDSGFCIYEQVLDASKFNVPQTRQRLFILGLSRRLTGKFNTFQFPDGTANNLTVESVIKGFPSPTFFSKNLQREDIPFHPNHWTMVPKSPKFFAPHTDNSGRCFRKLKWDKKSPTIAYGHREIHVHPDGNRRLSIYEAMLLQGFPKDYEILGNLSQQVEQVSNAVPPPLAMVVASTIINHLYSD